MAEKEAGKEDVAAGDAPCPSGAGPRAPSPALQPGLQVPRLLPPPLPSLNDRWRGRLMLRVAALGAGWPPLPPPATSLQPWAGPAADLAGRRGVGVPGPWVALGAKMMEVL